MICAGLILLALQLILPTIIVAVAGILMLICDRWFRKIARKSDESLRSLIELLQIKIDQPPKKKKKAA
jgi:hypothetical protein